MINTTKDLVRNYFGLLGQKPEDQRVPSETEKGRFKTEHPEDAEFVDLAFDCYKREKNPDICTELAWNINASEKSGELLLSRIEGLGNMAIKQKWSRSQYLRYMRRLEHQAQFELDPQQMDFFNKIVEQYSAQLSGSVVDDVKTYLRSDPEWNERLALYTNHIKPNVPLSNPTRPKNEEAWEERSLCIEGFSHCIPTFLPKGWTFAWPIYEERFEVGFEVLKTHIGPKDMERLLHPGYFTPDFSIYIWGDFRGHFSPDNSTYIQDGGPQAFSESGIDIYKEGTNFAGRYSSMTHIVSAGIQYDNNEDEHCYPGYGCRLLSDVSERLSPLERAENFLITNPLTVFYHEMGHAIQAINITGESFKSLSKLYEATWKKILPDSPLREKAIKPAASPWTKAFQEVKKEAVNLEYVPRNHEDNFYALTNPKEFFAEMMVESIDDSLARRQSSNPNRGRRNDASSTRHKFMSTFFKKEGIDPTVFDRETLPKFFDFVPPSNEKDTRPYLILSGILSVLPSEEGIRLNYGFNQTATLGAGSVLGGNVGLGFVANNFFRLGAGVYMEKSKAYLDYAEWSDGLSSGVADASNKGIFAQMGIDLAHQALNLSVNGTLGNLSIERKGETRDYDLTGIDLNLGFIYNVAGFRFSRKWMDKIAYANGKGDPWWTAGIYFNPGALFWFPDR